jgi:hemerythrin superfamily protein
MADISAQLKGTGKQLESVLKGRTAIYSTLAKEHGEVSALLNKAIKAKSAVKRTELLNEIRLELLSHSYAEEETLYAALSRFDEMQQKAKHQRGEHQEIERLLKDAFAAPPESAEQTEALEDLQTTIEHHVKEEEDQLFAQAKDLLSREEEKQLDENFAELKETKKRQLEGDGFGLAKGPLEDRH